MGRPLLVGDPCARVFKRSNRMHPCVPQQVAHAIPSHPAGGIRCIRSLVQLDKLLFRERPRPVGASLALLPVIQRKVRPCVHQERHANSSHLQEDAARHILVRWDQCGYNDSIVLGAGTRTRSILLFWVRRPAFCSRCAEVSILGGTVRFGICGRWLATAIFCTSAYGCGSSDSGGADATVLDALEQDGQPSACNPVLELGCDGLQRCTMYHDEVTLEVGGTPVCTVMGTVAAGSICSVDSDGIDDCVSGLGCRSTCVRWCDSSSPCEEGFCEQGPGIYLCYQPCDPFDSQSCSDYESCYLPVSQRSIQSPGCAPNGSVLEGETCSYADDCVPGHACASGVCQQICDVEELLMPCGDAEHCVEWTTEAAYGVCVDD